ncbi:MAG: hypothetical protein ACRD2Z_06065 [Thermoanaerobaculia bacterium]
MSHQEPVSLPRPDQVRFRAPGVARPPVLMGAGVALLLLAWLLGRSEPAHWLASYLVAFLFALTIALGGLFFTLMLYTSRAAWGVVARRLAEAAGATLPLFLILFLPVALGAAHLYPWIGEAHGAGHHAELLAHKAPYLNLPFFHLRAALCLLAWAAMGWWFWRRSLSQDAAPDPRVAARLRAWSHAALVLFAVTVTVASFDWVMSLTPTWYSTMFGVYFFAGIAVASLALLVVLTIALERRGALGGTLTAEHLHDLGKLLFSFVVFWAYIAFSQFLLIWYANLPEETGWYALRLAGGWRTATVALAVGHFVVPFFYLLSRDIKRRRLTLLIASVWMLLLHLLDLAWLVLPALPTPAGGWVLPVALCTVGIGILVAGLFVALLERAATVPTGDPRLAESLVIESG